jgi:hypothetical protein
MNTKKALSFAFALFLPACVGGEAATTPAADAGADASASPDASTGPDAASDASVAPPSDSSVAPPSDDSGPAPGVDSGTDAGTHVGADAGTDSGASSGTDSGPGVDASLLAPAVSLVTPNLGSSVGGWTITVTGSNFVSGAGITINGSPCKSVVWVSPTTLTATTPPFSTPNGSSNAQSVVVTNPDHQAGTGAGVAGSYFYLPSNSPIVMFQRGDVGITVSTFVSGWADQSGNGNDWSQPTVAHQPGTSPNYNGTGLRYLTFDGTTDYMTNTFTTPISAGVASMFVVGNFTTTTSASPVSALFLGGSGSTDLYFQGPGTGDPAVYVGNTVTAIASSTTPDTKPHVFTAIGNGAASSIQVDSQPVATGSLPSADLSSVNALGADQRGGAPHYFAPMDVLLVLVMEGALSAADTGTVQAILKATSNTP